MAFDEKHAPLLKAWIVKRLETPSRTDSDVDADVLADYVLALLRHDGSAADVQKLCQAELYDFLKDETARFVKDVFEALSYKSYLPSALQPPRSAQPKSLPSATIATNPRVASSQGHGALQTTAGAAPPPNGARKRTYQESSLSAAAQNGTDTNNGRGAFPQGGRGGERATKQPRRGSAARGGRGRGRGRGALSDLGSHMNMPAALPPFVPVGVPSTPGAIPYQAGFPARGSAPTSGQQAMFDSNDPSRPFLVAEILRMQQQLGLPLPPYANYGTPAAGQHTKRPRRPRRCRNFEKKGTCTRPNCPFDHSAPVENSPSSTQAPMTPTSLLQFQQSAGFSMLPSIPPLYMAQQQAPSLPQNKQQRPRGSGGEEPSNFKKSSIVVHKIPDEFLNEGDVRNHFSLFGTIVSVMVQPEERMAVVEFDSQVAAMSALRSPKTIFDNRFVTLSWLNEEHPSSLLDGKFGEEEEADTTPEMDMEEFIRKQEESQKTFEEKKRKIQELNERRQELAQRHKVILANQRAVHQKLFSKMAAMATKTKNRQNGDEASEAGTPDASKSAAQIQTEMIRAQLTALEEEAKLLGIDPDLILGDQSTGGSTDDDSKSATYSSWTPRGGSYGRGRGGFPQRGRGGYGGSYTPRGGGGGDGTIASAYAAYSLDNRPRRVAVSGVDFTDPNKGEALRHYLLGVGDFSAMETTDKAATITFADRRTAEKFFYGLPRTSAKKEEAASRSMPGIDVPVELSWVAGVVPADSGGSTSGSGSAFAASAPVSASAEAGKDRNGAGGESFIMEVEDNDLEEGEEREEAREQEHRQPRLQQQNMDFDVADEGDWDIQ